MSETGFLSRWSRRKLEAEQSETPVVATAEIEEPENEVVPAKETQVAEYIDEEIVATLPDIESLDGESDFSGFMQKGVPADLRKLALRKLWSSNPIFSNLDGLNDYDEDFATIVPLAEGVAEELKRLMQENRRESLEEESEEEDENQEDMSEEVAEDRDNLETNDLKSNVYEGEREE